MSSSSTMTPSPHHHHSSSGGGIGGDSIDDHHTNNNNNNNKSNINIFFQQLTSKQSLFYISIIAILFEILFNIIIIKKVSYTEIDWIAYMEEVKGFLNGDWDYSHLHGQTGPLVYPALFVYIYSILNIITLDGSVIIGQYIFVLIYIFIFIIVITLYLNYSKFNNNKYIWIIIMLMLSKRIHSIFVLRMFNDCIAMMFLYLAILCFCKDYYKFGLFFYSCALGIKMNILLFLPAVGILIVQRFGFTFKSILKLIIFIFGLQILFAIPFIYGNMFEYFNYAFDFGREFTFKWTVNFRFLNEEFFKSKLLAKLLLLLHVLFLLIFIFTKWCNGKLFKNPFHLLFKYKNNKPLDTQHVIYLMFTSNFIGFIFARSLHYQFYVWYFHTIPFMLMFIPYFKFNFIRLVILLAIEYVWNVYPSTSFSSALLHLCHFIILLGLLFTPSPASKMNENGTIINQNNDNNNINDMNNTTTPTPTTINQSNIVDNVSVCNNDDDTKKKNN